jgi:transcriptional regulator with XRE-family HTH domain
VDGVAVEARSATVGELLRSWRARRRLSQLELALDAEVSQRHLSFIELGRANPSRRLVVRLASKLALSPRDRNALLVAAGYAPVYTEAPLQAQELLSVRRALKKILAGHEPFPAVVVDRCFDVVSSNEPARAILTEKVGLELLTPRPNTMRVALHPRGLAPRIINLPELATCCGCERWAIRSSRSSARSPRSARRATSPSQSCRSSRCSQPTRRPGRR